MRVNYTLYVRLILTIILGEDHELVPGIVQGLAMLDDVGDIFWSMTCWG